VRLQRVEPPELPPGDDVLRCPQLLPLALLDAALAAAVLILQIGAEPGDRSEAGLLAELIQNRAGELRWLLEQYRRGALGLGEPDDDDGNNRG
jgi:hypothetical protein